MRDRDELRSARTESLFRDVNERIAEAADRLDGNDASFVCECDHPRCAHRIDTSLESYELVREDGATFLVVNEHVNEEIERVVARRRGFSIVEKIKPLVRRTVRELNPRDDAA